MKSGLDLCDIKGASECAGGGGCWPIKLGVGSGPIPPNSPLNGPTGPSMGPPTR